MLWQRRVRARRAALVCGFCLGVWGLSSPLPAQAAEPTEAEDAAQGVLAPFIQSIWEWTADGNREFFYVRKAPDATGGTSWYWVVCDGTGKYAGTAHRLTDVHRSGKDILLTREGGTPVAIRLADDGSRCSGYPGQVPRTPALPQFRGVRRDDIVAQIRARKAAEAARQQQLDAAQAAQQQPAQQELSARDLELLGQRESGGKSDAASTVGPRGTISRDALGNTVYTPDPNELRDVLKTMRDSDNTLEWRSREKRKQAELDHTLREWESREKRKQE